MSRKSAPIEVEMRLTDICRTDCLFSIRFSVVLTQVEKSGQVQINTDWTQWSLLIKSKRSPSRQESSRTIDTEV